VVNNILLFPNCDLHLTSSPVTSLPLRVVLQSDGAEGDHRYRLTTLKFEQCVFDWFRPQDPVGRRLMNPPAMVPGDGVNATAVITNATPGIYLFQIRVGTFYLVGRLQVHQRVESWWFGHESITTAKHPVAHTQPSVYARFSDDHDAGTDLIGDITGHGFVALTSSDPTTFTVTTGGRLLGLKTTPDPAHPPRVSGTWAALNPHDTPGSVPVQVVDYTGSHPILKSVRTTGLDAGFAAKHNIIFLAEGFGAGDEELFTGLVEQTTEEMFTKPRHEPYPLLKDHFNVFQAFTPSTQRTLTPGLSVTTDKSNRLPRGTPIPAADPFPDPLKYRMNDLISLVGLPTRNEPPDEAGLRKKWTDQGLTGPDPNNDLNLDRVDTAVIEEWRKHRADGILNARDTFYGMYTGVRWGDRFGRPSIDPVTGQVRAIVPPADDKPAEKATRDFVRRVYEFYTNQVAGTVILQLDPRRHPPELYATSFQTNVDNTVTQFLGGLTFVAPPSTTLAIGQEWLPNDRAFQRSRGLVVMLCLDDHFMGQNINNRSLTALSGGRNPVIDFVQAPNGSMTRTPPAKIDPDLDEIVSTVAHELGHSFNLDDEYENSGGPGPAPSDPDVDIAADNVTQFGFITAGDENFPDDISPLKVKWLTVPRTFVSSRLTGSTTTVANGLRVPIDRNDVGQWMRAKATPGLPVELRTITYTPPPTKQLPLDDPELIDLSIVDVDPAGAVIVAGIGVPPATQFPAGSLLRIPLLDKPNGDALFAVEAPVVQFLRDFHRPINRDTDTKLPNNNKDVPRLIRGLLPPCKSYQVLGVYEGAEHFAAHYYRPAGACKMRDNHEKNEQAGQFCFICKWLIVNRVDPGMHGFLTQRFYPKSKSGPHG
jgi:hypothetical protein